MNWALRIFFILTHSLSHLHMYHIKYLMFWNKDNNYVQDWQKKKTNEFFFLSKIEMSVKENIQFFCKKS